MHVIRRRDDDARRGPSASRASRGSRDTSSPAAAVRSTKRCSVAALSCAGQRASAATCAFDGPKSRHGCGGGAGAGAVERLAGGFGGLLHSASRESSSAKSQSHSATTFWLITARVLTAPMPETPTVATLTSVARRLEATAEHVARDDREAGRRRRGGLDELAAGHLAVVVRGTFRVLHRILPMLLRSDADAEKWRRSTPSAEHCHETSHRLPRRDDEPGSRSLSAIASHGDCSDRRDRTARAARAAADRRPDSAGGRAPGRAAASAPSSRRRSTMPCRIRTPASPASCRSASRRSWRWSRTSASSFATAGFKRIIFLNGHYDNTYAIAYACANAADACLPKDAGRFPSTTGTA